MNRQWAKFQKPVSKKQHQRWNAGAERGPRKDTKHLWPERSNTEPPRDRRKPP